MPIPLPPRPANLPTDNCTLCFVFPCLPAVLQTAKLLHRSEILAGDFFLRGFSKSSWFVLFVVLEKKSQRDKSARTKTRKAWFALRVFAFGARWKWWWCSGTKTDRSGGNIAGWWPAGGKAITEVLRPCPNPPQGHPKVKTGEVRLVGKATGKIVIDSDWAAPGSIRQAAADDEPWRERCALFAEWLQDCNRQRPGCVGQHLASSGWWWVRWR